MENPNKLKRYSTPFDLILLGASIGIFIGLISLEYGVLDQVIYFLLGGALVRLIYISED